MTDRKAKQRRLERAGYVYVAGWVPEYLPENMGAIDSADAYISPDGMQEWIDSYLPFVEAIVAEPAKPRGRPRLQPIANRDA